jgi:hypothetical protein
MSGKKQTALVGEPGGDETGAGGAKSSPHHCSKFRQARQPCTPGVRLNAHLRTKPDIFGLADDLAALGRQVDEREAEAEMLRARRLSRLMSLGRGGRDERKHPTI